jgi:uncharacterized lipoprotein NlpE involved in copper resistance
MKRALTLFLATFAAIALLIGFAGCSNLSEADKAYGAWGEKSLPLANAATETFTEEAAAADGDPAAILAASQKFLDTVKPIRDELAAIDQTQLTDELKASAAEALAGLDQSISTLEASVAELEKSIAG